MAKQNVAFISYNLFADGLANGWHETEAGRAFLMQNTKNLNWGGGIAPTQYTYDSTEGDRLEKSRISEAERQWAQLTAIVADVDHTVVYLGTGAAMLRIIAHAKALPAAKLTFVVCDCNYNEKERTIRSAGLESARHIGCECGGHSTMGRLFARFLETGTV